MKSATSFAAASFRRPARVKKIFRTAASFALVTPAAGTCSGQQRAGEVFVRIERGLEKERRRPSADRATSETMRMPSFSITGMVRKKRSSSARSSGGRLISHRCKPGPPGGTGSVTFAVDHGATETSFSKVVRASSTTLSDSCIGWSRKFPISTSSVTVSPARICDWLIDAPRMARLSGFGGATSTKNSRACGGSAVKSTFAQFRRWKSDR